MDDQIEASHYGPSMEQSIDSRNKATLELTNAKRDFMIRLTTSSSSQVSRAFLILLTAKDIMKRHSIGLLLIVSIVEVCILQGFEI